MEEMLDSETRKRFSIRSGSKGNQICIILSWSHNIICQRFPYGMVHGIVFILDLGSNVTMLKCFECNPARQPNLHNEALDSH